MDLFGQEEIDSTKLGDQPVKRFAINAAYGQASSIPQDHSGIAVQEWLPFRYAFEIHNR